MRVILSSGSVTAVLLFGLAAILAPLVTEAAGISKGRDIPKEAYVPYQGERFDLFDWNLCKKLARGYSGNMIISPISIKLALILLYEGAADQTKHELATALQLTDNSLAVRDRFVKVLSSLQKVGPEYALDISTRLIVDTSISPSQQYKAIAKTYYSADVKVANLTDSRVALKDINDWVSNVTHGHVKKVLTDEEKLKDSVFLVLNGLYFKGTWRQPFSTSMIRTGAFYTDVDKSVQVSYMNNAGNFYYVEAPHLDARILRLPYLGNKYAMFIVLPRARTGIHHLINNINPYDLSGYIQRMEEVPLDISIPKFKFEFTSHLENVLRELGIRDIFDNTASFSVIARAKQYGQRLMVSDFVQKAGLEVDEVGTTAYAVTEVNIGNKISDISFHVTHPFLIFVEDETTGTVVFIAKITNPTESSGILEEPFEEKPARSGVELLSTVLVPAPGKTKG